MLTTAASHPSSKIQDELADLIRSDEVRVKYDPIFQGPAYVTFLQEDGKRIPLLVVGQSLSSLSLERRWMVLVHENEQIEAILEGSYNFDWSFGSSTSIEGVKKWYEQQMQALLIECNFAKEIGAIHLRSECEVYSSEGVCALRRVWAEEMGRYAFLWNYKDILRSKAEEGCTGAKAARKRVAFLFENASNP